MHFRPLAAACAHTRQPNAHLRRYTPTANHEEPFGRRDIDSYILPRVRSSHLRQKPDDLHGGCSAKSDAENVAPCRHPPAGRPTLRARGRGFFLLDSSLFRLALSSFFSAELAPQRVGPTRLRDGPDCPRVVAAFFLRRSPNRNQSGTRIAQSTAPPIAARPSCLPLAWLVPERLRSNERDDGGDSGDDSEDAEDDGERADVTNDNDDNGR